MDHWKAALRLWEPLAFDNVVLYRERPANAPVPGDEPEFIAWLFTVLWGAMTIYLLLCVGLRLSGCPLP